MACWRRRAGTILPSPMCRWQNVALSSEAGAAQTQALRPRKKPSRQELKRATVDRKTPGRRKTRNRQYRHRPVARQISAPRSRRAGSTLPRETNTPVDPWQSVSSPDPTSKARVRRTCMRMRSPTWYAPSSSARNCGQGRHQFASSDLSAMLHTARSLVRRGRSRCSRA